MTCRTCEPGQGVKVARDGSVRAVAHPQVPSAPVAARPEQPPAGRTRALPRPPQLLVAFVAILSASLLLYLQPVFDLGFYYDDWLLQATFGDASGRSLGDLFSACRVVEPAGRPGGCAYHSTVYALLGADPAAYHVLSIVLLVASTLLFYLLLRRCGLGHWPALLVCVLYVVYPGSDSTRLWPTSIGAQYILGAYLAGVLLAIEGLRRDGRKALACHIGSLLLFLLLVFTYEVVIPLIGVAGALYLLATKDRRAALIRGAFDLTLAAIFTFYRLVFAPVDAASGFVPERTLSESLDHVSAVLRGAWVSWHSLFVPGTAAAVVAVVAVLVIVTAAADDAKTRRAIVVWLAIAAGAAAFAVLAVAPYFAANGLYVPDTYSLFNRLNIVSAPAYCLLFVALAGALWSALSHWLAGRVATVIVGVLIAGVAVSQVDVARESQSRWAASWDAQRTAIKGLKLAAPRLPADATVMSFGHPLWEPGFIPVFSAGWDLRGAIDVETPLDPPAAVPFMDTAVCTAQGADVAGAPFARYAGVASPLWFVNTSTGDARRIASRKACVATAAEWGRPPFFDPAGPT